MTVAPLHYFTKLFPVCHLFKGHQFHRGAGNNHTVVPVFFDFVKSGIVRQQILGAGVFGRVGGGLQQLNFDLQRRVGQASCVSVATFVGMRLKITMRIARISCRCART
jgi:hypothetical protein